MKRTASRVLLPLCISWVVILGFLTLWLPYGYLAIDAAGSPWPAVVAVLLTLMIAAAASAWIAHDLRFLIAAPVAMVLWFVVAPRTLLVMIIEQPAAGAGVWLVALGVTVLGAAVAIVWTRTAQPLAKLIAIVIAAVVLATTSWAAINRSDSTLSRLDSAGVSAYFIFLEAIRYMIPMAVAIICVGAVVEILDSRAEPTVTGDTSNKGIEPTAQAPYHAKDA